MTASRDPAGAAQGDGPWTPALVEAQLREAIATLMALPDREREWLMSCRSSWPSAATARPGTAAAASAGPPRRRKRCTPSPGAIDRMLPTLLWIRQLDEDGQRVLWMRGLDMSWARIGAQIGRSGPTARRWHWAALALIAARLNRLAAAPGGRPACPGQAKRTGEPGAGRTGSGAYPSDPG